jgi:hypothetical protein
MTNYRAADSKTQWFQDNYPGATMDIKASNLVLVIHTTETTSWPDYEGGATAPNYTGQPPLNEPSDDNFSRGSYRAHFPDEKSARALQNLPGGVETNTLNAIQLELIGSCDPKNAKRWGRTSTTRLAGRDYVYWPEATPRQLRWVARFVADLNRRHGLRLVAPREFLAYPASYGDSPVRLRSDDWKRVTGVLGHQHVPENVHGDPGNLNVPEILRIAKDLIAKNP